MPIHLTAVIQQVVVAIDLEGDVASVAGICIGADQCGELYIASADVVYQLGRRMRADTGLIGGAVDGQRVAVDGAVLLDVAPAGSSGYPVFGGQRAVRQRVARCCRLHSDHRIERHGDRLVGAFIRQKCLDRDRFIGHGHIARGDAELDSKAFSRGEVAAHGGGERLGGEAFRQVEADADGVNLRCAAVDKARCQDCTLAASQVAVVEFANNVSAFLDVLIGFDDVHLDAVRRDGCGGNRGVKLDVVAVFVLLPDVLQMIYIGVVELVVVVIVVLVFFFQQFADLGNFLGHGRRRIGAVEHKQGNASVGQRLYEVLEIAFIAIADALDCGGILVDRNGVLVRDDFEDFRMLVERPQVVAEDQRGCHLAPQAEVRDILVIRQGRTDADFQHIRMVPAVVVVALFFAVLASILIQFYVGIVDAGDGVPVGRDIAGSSPHVAGFAAPDPRLAAAPFADFQRDRAVFFAVLLCILLRRLHQVRAHELVIIAGGVVVAVGAADRVVEPQGVFAGFQLKQSGCTAARCAAVVVGGRQHHAVRMGAVAVDVDEHRHVLVGRLLVEVEVDRICTVFRHGYGEGCGARVFTQAVDVVARDVGGAFQLRVSIGILINFRARLIRLCDIQAVNAICRGGELHIVAIIVLEEVDLPICKARRVAQLPELGGRQVLAGVQAVGRIQAHLQPSVVDLIGEPVPVVREADRVKLQSPVDVAFGRLPVVVEVDILVPGVIQIVLHHRVRDIDDQILIDVGREEVPARPPHGRRLGSPVVVRAGARCQNRCHQKGSR